ncbi:MAG: hypothetical protein ACP5VP_05630 [Candidatus Limnocylindrales bacterium]
MRFADWQATPEGSRYLTDRLVPLIESAARTLGAHDATPCYVAWGDQPEARFQVMLSTDGGLGIFNVRVSVPQEGPRLSGRLVRWARVQAGEVTFEAHSGHIQVSAQFEGQVLLGLDEAGERIAEWMTEVYRRVDGAARGG